jgi:membrane-associated phospholipid phosphatase
MGPFSAAAMIVGSAVAVARGHADTVDRPARALIADLRTDERDAFIRVATDLGSLYGVGVVAGTLALVGRGERARRVASAGVTAWTLAQAAKRTLPRGRPYEVDGAERLVVEPAGSSWPSGHAAVAMAMAEVLGQGRGPLARHGLVLAAKLVGLSRVYVGVHHLTDVIAGMGIGAMSARPFLRRR